MWINIMNVKSVETNTAKKKTIWTVILIYHDFHGRNDFNIFTNSCILKIFYYIYKSLYIYKQNENKDL